MLPLYWSLSNTCLSSEIQGHYYRTVFIGSSDKMQRHFLNSKIQPPDIPSHYWHPPPSPQVLYRSLTPLPIIPMLPTWNPFSKFYGFFFLNLFWIHCLSFISISSAIALAPTNTCFLTEFSDSFYWFPSHPLCFRFLSYFCMYKSIHVLHYLKPFVGFCTFFLKSGINSFWYLEAFMVSFIPSIFSHFLTCLSDFAAQTIYYSNIWPLYAAVGNASLLLLLITSSTEVNIVFESKLFGLDTVLSFILRQCKSDYLTAIIASSTKWGFVLKIIDIS